MSTWSAPVRYGECDQQGVVFHAHYLAWADEASSAWFAATGTTYPALRERGLDMVVRASTLEWSFPARYGDVVEVDAVCEQVGRTSWVVAYAVRVGGRRCCTVRNTYVLVGADGRPVPVPDDLRAAWLP